MSKTVKTRVEELEKLAGVTDTVIAVRREDSQVVKITHSGEELALDEFWSRYPDGVLLHVVRKDTPPDTKIVVSWDDIEDE
jgi:hypothetical protein